MRIRDIIACIEEMAPLSGAADWDRSGLQVYSPRTEASRVCVALDPTPETVKKALGEGADFIFTHHPLALKPGLPNRPGNYYETLSLLMKADVPLYAAHTSLDVQPDGPAGWLARFLQFVHPSLLDATGPDTGFGLAGDLPGAMSFDDLVRRLGTVINLDTAVVIGDVPEKITRAAYCTGSGASLLPEAERSGAQIYITGDVKYHAALDARICVLDVGHHSLEEEMMRQAAQMLAGRLTGADVSFIASVPPMRRVVLS